MKWCKVQLSSTGPRRRAAVAVQVAVMSTMLFSFAALAVDVSVMYNARGELQRTADAAAMAATARLTAYDEGDPLILARQAAIEYTERNTVLGRELTLAESDVTFGRAVLNPTTGSYDFNPTLVNPNAVRVVVRQTADSPNQALPLYFAAIFGKHDTDVSAEAIAMLVPRDIAVVADLSGSHNDDSELRHYRVTAINMREMWGGLPITSGVNGVGDGVSPPPPGDPLNPAPPPGVGPGHPGDDGTGQDPGMGPGGAPSGPTWGWMYYWGSLLDPANYDPLTDPGLIHLPRYQEWNDNDLGNWLHQVGYNGPEVHALTHPNYDGSQDSWGQYGWTNRVAVALGLARWDSGISGGLWETIPPEQRNTGNGNAWAGAGELTWLVDYPFNSGSWSDFIYSYMNSTSTQMYYTNTDFRYRFGLKTFLNYLLERKYRHVDTPELAGAPVQPMQAVKDGVQVLADTITGLESEDQLSLEIYGTLGRHEVDLTSDYAQVSGRLHQMQAGHYDAWTNTGAGILRAIDELTGPRADANSRSVIFLMTDGYANVACETCSGGDYTGGRAYALAMAQQAADLGIQISTVSVGSYADLALMDQIAAIGDGIHLNATGALGIEAMSQQLNEIFNRLGGARPVELIR